MPIKPRGCRIYFPTLSTTVIADSVSYSFESEFFDRVEFSNERLRNAKNTDGSKPVFYDMFGGKVLQLSTSCGSANTVRPVTPDDANIDNIKKRWDIKRYKLSGISLDADINLIYQTGQAHKILLDRFLAHQAQAQMDISYTALVAMQSETFSYLTTTSFAMYGDGISPNGYVGTTVLAGVSTINLSTANQFVVGQSVIINAGNGTAEVKVIQSIGSGTLTFTSALTNGHSANETVQLYETNMLIAELVPEVDKVIRDALGGYTVRKTWSLTLENRVLKNARATS